MGPLRIAPVVLLFMSPGLSDLDYVTATTKEGQDYYQRPWKGFEPLPVPVRLGRSRRRYFVRYIGAGTAGRRMNRSFDNPEHWRRRAEEMRRPAEAMRDLITSATMLEIADQYDRLALV